MVEETTKLLHSPPKSPKQGPNPVMKRSMKNTQSFPSRVSNTNQKQGQRKDQTLLTKRGPGSPEKEPREHVYVTQGSPPKPREHAYAMQGSPPKPREHAYATQGSPPKPREHAYAMQGSPPKPREHVYATQGSPPKDEKYKYSPKSTPKEKTIREEKIFRLHSEERAVRRASFNSMMASKINYSRIIRRFEEKIMKVIEEEEIKEMRKEMVPKAQLMPFFDRPFYPQRSTRPLTKPKEPSFLKEKCCIGGEFHRHFCFNTKAIK